MPNDCWKRAISQANVAIFLERVLAKSKRPWHSKLQEILLPSYELSALIGVWTSFNCCKVKII